MTRARGGPGGCQVFFCFFLHKKAPPFGGAKCLRGAHLHQMRDLVVERVRFCRDFRLDKYFVLNSLRKGGGAFVQKPTCFVHMGEGEVRDSIQEFDIALAQAGGVDVAHALAEDFE